MEISQILSEHYNIHNVSLSEVQPGWSALAYRVETDSGLYFLKVYDKSLPTTHLAVERIDFYMPVLSWLSKTSALCGRILTPISTRNGTYKVETASNMYVLFSFIKGNMPGIQSMTKAQTIELAETLAILHTVSETIPFETTGLDEDVSLPFCGQMTQFLDSRNTENDTLSALIFPHTELLRESIRDVLQLRDTVRIGHSPLVLCHGDAHGNNVIQGERLVLVDWEDLRRAPAEADLFIYAWHPHGDALFEAYSAARSGYRINRKLLYFYVLRRRIEDVWVDIQRLTEENPDESEIAKLIGFIRRGIDEIKKIYTNKSMTGGGIE